MTVFPERSALHGATLAEVIEHFVEAPAVKGTAFWKDSHLEFWRARLGAMRIADITKADINAAKSALQSRPVVHNGKLTGEKLSPGTVNRYLASLSSVFNFACDREIIDLSPMRGGAVKRLAESTGRRRILTAEEQAALLDAAKQSSWPMLHLFVRMCLTTAARRGEVLNLRWADVNFADSTAMLRRTKNGTQRALPLVSDVKAALTEAKKVQPMHSDFIFFDPRRPERPKPLVSVWKQCRIKAGLWEDRDDPLDRVYLHSTRHTAVTRMLKGGANIAQVAVVSGHKTLSVLAKYTHLNAADAVALAEKHLK